MQTLSLFDDMVVDVPKTQGIKYAGSKLKLLPHILQLINKVNPKTVLDGFAGTTRVSQNARKAQTGHSSVIANDICCRLVENFLERVLSSQSTHSEKHYQPLIDHLNVLPGKDGWFTEHYGGDPNGGSSVGEDNLKKPWQKHNTRRLDAIREEIEQLSLSEVEKAVLLTSLIFALDEVDSTLGHFASYLHDWSPRSYNEIAAYSSQTHSCRQELHTVHQGDIFDLVPKIETDLAYFDPPYGSSNEKMPPSRVRYAAYYHLWTSICLYDKPAVFGKAKRRTDTSDTISSSVFEDFFRKSDAGRFIVVEAIERLLKATRAGHIIPLVLQAFRARTRHGGRN